MANNIKRPPENTPQEFTIILMSYVYPKCIDTPQAIIFYTPNAGSFWSSLAYISMRPHKHR